MNVKEFLRKNLVPIILGLLVVLGFVSGLWKEAELGFYDTWFNVRGVVNPGKNIVIIAMDEKSISALGPLPWRRSEHALLLQRLERARVVAFDVVFDTNTDKKDDSALMEAVKKNERVILASMSTFEQDEKGEWLISLKTPIPELLDVAGTGYINMPSDKGNMVRRVTVINANYASPIPSFGLTIAMAAQGIFVPEQFTIHNDRLKIGSINIPLGKLNETYINYWGPARTFPTYSYSDVLAGKISPAVFKNAIVLIGPYSPTEQQDTYYTPFTRSNMILSGGLPSPGVEIHASAIKTYLTNSYFYPASIWVNLLFLIIVWGLTVFITRNRSPWLGLALALVLAAGLCGGVYLLWLKAHYWLNIVGPFAMVGLVYTGTTVESFVRTELERRKTRAVFSRYVSPEVVNEILKQDSDLELGGVKRVVTIMFADIRGFTAFSENKDPVDVIARLNEYLTAMTNSIQSHGGTLDKYLGDGLMAFFGAPLYLEDHVERAVKVAVEIQHKVEELNRKWEAIGAVPLKVAVGINTGPAVVGNVGSPERMDYTLIGEDVNLASRVEALSKLFQTLIVVSERSYNLLPEGEIKESLYYLGAEQVKGFTQPIACYSVKGLNLHFEKSTDKGFK